MSNYKITDAMELGDASSLIRDKETMNLDEVSGSWGPLTDEVEAE